MLSPTGAGGNPAALVSASALTGAANDTTGSIGAPIRDYERPTLGVKKKSTTFGQRTQSSAAAQGGQRALSPQARGQSGSIRGGMKVNT